MILGALALSLLAVYEQRRVHTASAGADDEAVLSLRAICAERSWELIEVLRIHHRKRTATGRVRLANGQIGVLKAALEGAPWQSVDGLRREREVYVSLGMGLAPVLIDTGERWLCRSFEDGVALRSWLGRARDAADVAALVRAVVESLAVSRAPASPTQLPAASRALASRVRNLLTSGPTGTVRGVASARAGAVVARVGVPALDRLFEGIVRCWQTRGALLASAVSHNDLHIDNVVVSSGGPHIVDFENATWPGFYWVDALYFAATCQAAMASAGARAGVTSGLVQALRAAEPRLEPEISWMQALLFAAATSNARFRLERSLDAGDLRVLARAPTALAHLVRAR